jgi:hypothetical protein
MPLESIAMLRRHGSVLRLVLAERGWWIHDAPTSVHDVHGRVLLLSGVGVHGVVARGFRGRFVVLIAVGIGFTRCFGSIAGEVARTTSAAMWAATFAHSGFIGLMENSHAPIRMIRTSREKVQR